MKVFLKALLYFLLFILLHFGYDITHLNILKPFCGINESVFQHLKMAYWSYLIASLFEYFWVKRKAFKWWKFFYTRSFTTVIVPWMIFLVWYLAPAIFGKSESKAMEILWALLVTYFSGVAGSFLDKEFEKIENLSIFFRWLLILLLLVSAFLFILFTYKSPFIDVFVDPSTL